MTTDLWLPGFPVHLGKAGGPYDDTATPKLGWHTWEGLSWAGAETAFRPYPPHIACKPPHPAVPAREVGKRQYIPLNRHAYAFAGSENDDEYIIQVEVAGTAAGAHDWTDQVCEWLYDEIVEPLERAVGIPPVVIPAGFHDPTPYRPTVATNYLASSRSEIRLTAATLRAFSGHLGHQHMPPPDSHWDPGRLPIDRILRHRTKETPDMDATQDRRLKNIETRLERLIDLLHPWGSEKIDRSGNLGGAIEAGPVVRGALKAITLERFLSPEVIKAAIQEAIADVDAGDITADQIVDKLAERLAS